MLANYHVHRVTDKVELTLGLQPVEAEPAAQSYYLRCVTCGRRLALPCPPRPASPADASLAAQPSPRADPRRVDSTHRRSAYSHLLRELEALCPPARVHISNQPSARLLAGDFGAALRSLVPTLTPRRPGEPEYGSIGQQPPASEGAPAVHSPNGRGLSYLGQIPEAAALSGTESSDDDAPPPDVGEQPGPHPLYTPDSAGARTSLHDLV